jgi:hypothetical protein
MQTLERASIHRRFMAIAGVVLGLALIVGIAPASVDAREPFTRDVYFKAGYERQVDGRTCTAASTAMMLNFIAGKDLRLSQRSILGWAQRRDALNDARQRGSDPLGWAKALNYFSDRLGMDEVTYVWEASSSESAALKRAARQIADTEHPVGLLVQGGRHAVVMTGFQASRDPRKGDFELEYVWISDPIGSSHKRYEAQDSPLNRYRELDATPAYDKAWYGKFVTIVPQD